jgi:hypothetical protein
MIQDVKVFQLKIILLVITHGSYFNILMFISRQQSLRLHCLKCLKILYVLISWSVPS